MQPYTLNPLQALPIFLERLRWSQAFLNSGEFEPQSISSFHFFQNYLPRDRSGNTIQACMLAKFLLKPKTELLKCSCPDCPSLCLCHCMRLKFGAIVCLPISISVSVFAFKFLTCDQESHELKTLLFGLVSFFFCVKVKKPRQVGSLQSLKIHEASSFSAAFWIRSFHVPNLILNLGPASTTSFCASRVSSLQKVGRADLQMRPFPST